MTTFTLTIKTENAAFGESTQERNEEVIRILRSVIRQLDEDERYGNFFETLRDINGNDVGRAKFVEEEA